MLKPPRPPAFGSGMPDRRGTLGKFAEGANMNASGMGWRVAGGDGNTNGAATDCVGCGAASGGDIPNGAAAGDGCGVVGSVNTNGLGFDSSFGGSATVCTGWRAAGDGKTNGEATDRGGSNVTVDVGNVKGSETDCVV